MRLVLGNPLHLCSGQYIDEFIADMSIALFYIASTYPLPVSRRPVLASADTMSYVWI